MVKYRREILFPLTKLLIVLEKAAFPFDLSEYQALQEHTSLS